MFYVGRKHLFSTLSFQYSGCDWWEELWVAERDGVIILD